MTRTRRSLYTLGAQYLNTGISLVSGLVGFPLLLLWLGEDRVGLSRVGIELFGYQQLLAWGVDGALMVNYARAAAAKDRAATAAAIRGGVTAYLLVMIVSMCWIGALGLFTPVFFNLKATAPEIRGTLESELQAGLLIVLIGQSLVAICAFKPLAEAEQRGYTVHLCLAVGSLTMLVTSLLLAYYHFGLVGQFLAYTIAPLVAGLPLALDGLRRYPEVLRHPLGPRTFSLRSFFGVMLLYQLCLRFNVYSDCIIVSQVLGNAAVVPFDTTRKVSFLLMTVLAGIGGATWAALANLHFSGAHEAHRHRLVQLTRFVAVSACALLVPAAAWNREFVLAWVGKPELYAGDALSFAAATAAILTCTLMLWGQTLLTTGRARKVLHYYVPGTVVFVVVSLAACSWLGSIGPPLGTIASILGLTVWWCPRILSREFGIPMRKLLAAALGPWLLAIPYGLLLYALASTIVLQDWLPSRMGRFVAVALIDGIAAVVYLVLAVLIVIPVNDRREWLGRFRARKS